MQHPARQIVIIEDNPPQRQVVAYFLRRLGFEVAAFESAAPLLLPLEKPPDVLVIDVGLPGEDGVSFIRRLKKYHPDPKIIIVTACENPCCRTECYLSGADVVLTKPFDLSELEAILGNLLRFSKRVPSVALDRLLASLPARMAQIGELLLCEGLAYKQIADRLALSEGTVRTHVQRLYRRCKVNSRSELMAEILK